MLAEFNSILFNFIAVRLLLNYLARFAKPKFQKMTHPTRMYYTMTTYFDIVRLQVHSTLRSTSFVPQYIVYTVVTIVHLTFYTLHSLRCTLYATDTTQYFYIYCILYKVVLFFEVWRIPHSTLQHSIIHCTQYINR